MVGSPVFNLNNVWVSGTVMAIGFSSMSAAAKGTGKRLSSHEQIFLRSFLCLSIAPIFGETFRLNLKTSQRQLLLLRGILGFLAIFCHYEAIGAIPLATLTLITRLHPIMGSVLAYVFLGEPLQTRQVRALTYGTLGTLLLMSGSHSSLSVSTGAARTPNEVAPLRGYVFALLSASLTAAALLTVRILIVLGETPRNIRAAFHWANFLGSLTLGWIFTRGGPWLWPERQECAWICGAAIAMQIGQVGLNALLQHQFSKGSMFFFLSVVLNLVWGLLLGDPCPGIREIVGAGIIVGAVALGASGKIAA